MSPAIFRKQPHQRRRRAADCQAAGFPLTPRANAINAATYSASC